MFDRPRLSDRDVADAIRVAYGLSIRKVTFLGLGNDANAWTFRADLRGGAQLFVKLRRSVDDARLAATRHLFERGIEAVVAPLPTSSGGLSEAIGELALVAYPSIDARPAADVGLTEAQWVEYGSIVGRVHRTALTAELIAALPHETFVPSRVQDVDRIDGIVASIAGEPTADTAGRDLASLWRAKRPLIGDVVRRAVELSGGLGAQLARDDAGREGAGHIVPCHGDVHTHNVLVEATGRLRIVDWDQIVMAPPERDLMFIVGSPIGLAPGPPERTLFFEGYGPVDIDADRLAYYHADWALQDLVGYAEESIAAGASTESRAEALRILRGLFGPGDEVEVALGGR